MFTVAIDSPSETPSKGLSNRNVKLSGSSVMLSASMRRDMMYSVPPAGTDIVLFIGS